ncbi:hypothetical protein Vi05172_g11033 [Venturia inaequalis]|nr:hypothetical protein Vi05172_g11033 [Venturia inaequalis]
MEDQIVHLLADTQSAQESPRKHAELQLQTVSATPGFGIALVSVASHDSVPLNIRQAALLYLKTFVQSSWSPQFDEFKGQVLVNNEDKAQLRNMLLEIAVSGGQDRKIKAAASYAVSKIASADFPEEWPHLLPTVLQVVQAGADDQLHGALKVLRDLVDECFNDEQFFRVAEDLISAVYKLATDHTKRPILRALAVDIFRGCFDILEMVMEDHKSEVKAFADKALTLWVPFFIDILESSLPNPPTEADEESRNEVAQSYRGFVALKLQVVKVLMRIRSVFPSILSPQSPALFEATWKELSSLQTTYHTLFIEECRQSRLEDDDGLPYTLDFLVLEELDFMQACLRATPVRKQLEKSLQEAANSESSWVTEMMKLAVAYSQITTEEEGLWNIDVNIFLSEETSVTSNYTPRTACGDLVIKLGEWQSAATIEGLLAYTRTLYSVAEEWKGKEAALYILNMLLGDFHDMDRTIVPEAANGFIDFVRYAMQQEDEFLRARGYLVAGSLTHSAGEALSQVSSEFMQATINAITNDSSEVVKVACIRAVQHYMHALPQAAVAPMQAPIITALTSYIHTQDLNDLNESDDLMVTLVETLRDAIILDTRVSLTSGGLDLLFTIASHGASNFNISSLVTETFDDVAGTLASTAPDAYAQLCAKVLPSLTGAFDIATLTEENALTNLAAELLSLLSRHGSEPLPAVFVPTAMPKLNRILLNATDEELLRSATSAVKNILMHDYKQLFEWRDETGKGGLEVVLVIIDRLLGPSVDDNAAAEVGGLAAEVVEKAGSERLGPYLMQLLSAVAIRLGSATQAAFIQSLILVFARLSLVSAREVVDFLAQVQVGAENGLQVVMAKWLENSVNFAGYDEIRQNVIALSKLYDLGDARLAQIQVKGDLIVNPATQGRIMTRSRARNNPDQFTAVPATLKIVKVLIEELQAAGGAVRPQLSPAELEKLEEEVSDDGDWEDDPDVYDLGLGTTKQELMAFAEETPYSQRHRDDETQAYLIQFFHAAGTRPSFTADFNALTPEEQEKLRAYA